MNYSIDISSDCYKVFSPNALIISNSETYFPDVVRQYLCRYLGFLQARKNIHTDVFYTIKYFTQKICRCLETYYVGAHDGARFYFNEAMGIIEYESLILPLKDDCFYRARKSDSKNKADGRVFKKEEMFHISYEERYKVAAERYSYPGLPCLYLGNTPDVCRIELDESADNLDIAIVKRKRDMANVLVFDLFFFDTYNFNNLTEDQLKTFLIFFPLVACCSFSYRDAGRMSFKPHYILPQLLLEYLWDKEEEARVESELKGESLADTDNRIIGIRYHSVRERLFGEAANKFVNYVLPANTLQPTGYSRELEAIFEVESVYQYNQLPHVNDTFND